MQAERLAELHVCTGAAGDWARVYKTLQRSGARFLRVALGSDRSRFFLVCTTSLLDGEPLPAPAALDLLAEALERVPLTSGRPVTSTKGWLPLPAPSRKWAYCGDILASNQWFEETLVAAHEDGTLQGKILEPGVAARWEFEPEVSEEERDRIRRRLFGQTLPVDNEPRGKASSGESAPANANVAGKAV